MVDLSAPKKVIVVVDCFESSVDHIELAASPRYNHNGLVVMAFVKVESTADGAIHRRQTLEVSRDRLIAALADTAVLFQEQATADQPPNQKIV